MSKKTVMVTTCDKCDKELVGRLTYRTCPCCGKDICLACIEKEQAKHKPRERKPKAATNQPRKEISTPGLVPISHLWRGVEIHQNEEAASPDMPEDSKHQPKLGDRKLIDGVPAIYMKAGKDIVVKQASTSSDAPTKKTETKKETGADLISSFSFTKNERTGFYNLQIEDGKGGLYTVNSKTLKVGVEDLLGLAGLKRKDIEDAPDSEGKRNLLNILK